MSASDLGPPLTLLQMAHELGDVLIVTENRDGEICNTVVKLEIRQVYALRRIHNLLTRLAAVPDKVRDLLTWKQKPQTSWSKERASA